MWRPICQRGGGTAACAPPPVSLSAQPPRGSPAVNCRREPPPMGVGSGVFPRFPAAASSRDRGPSATTTAHTFGSSAGRKLLVRKRTSVSYLRACYILPRPRHKPRNPSCYPENSDPTCCLLAYALPVVS